MSSKKKPSVNVKKETTVKPAAKPVATPVAEASVIKKETLIYQFISESLAAEGTSGLKLPKTKVIIFECVANSVNEAYTMFKNDIKNQLKITSEDMVNNVLHDMFGERIIIRTIVEKDRKEIVGMCKRV